MGRTISPKMPFTPLATKRVSLLPDLRGTMTVPTTLTTVLSTSSAPAAAATSRAAIGAVISYPQSTSCNVVFGQPGVYSAAVAACGRVLAQLGGGTVAPARK